MITRASFRVVGVVAALLVFGVVVHAAEMPSASPEGDVILTVTGLIGERNAGEAAAFDRAMLESLPMERFSTNTIWTEGEQSFTGVPLTALLTIVGAEGRVVRATALNDYAVDIPMSDPTSQSALIAYEVNGQPMSIREKGPLWIVYPYDADKQFQTETLYSRSIWQLNRIEVLE